MSAQEFLVWNTAKFNQQFSGVEVVESALEIASGPMAAAQQFCERTRCKSGEVVVADLKGGFIKRYLISTETKITEVSHGPKIIEAD